MNDVALVGLGADDIGSTYPLFTVATDADITPTISAATWTIDGNPYSVTFTDNLPTEGTVTISNLTLIPEPSSALLAAFGLFALGLRRRRLIYQRKFTNAVRL